MDLRKSTVESVARWKQKVVTRKAAAGKPVGGFDVNNESQLNILRESLRSGLAATEIGVKAAPFPGAAYDPKAYRKYS